MTAKQFFDLVVEMRKAQKDYFASRKRKAPWEESNTLKVISQGFEEQIDAEIARVQRLVTEPELELKFE
jgi:hypothetical protein